MTSPRAGSEGHRPSRHAGWKLRALMAVAAALIIAFTSGFGWFAWRVSRMETPRDLAAADAIVVLTGGQLRLNAAVDLLQAGKGERLLISGVNPVARDHEVQRVAGADEDLFDCCVDLDRAALDTAGNAEESAKWVREHGYDRIILVTSNYHMPRSLLEMERLLSDIEMTAYPVVTSRIDDGSWMRKPEMVRLLFSEYTKYLGAFARAVFVPAGSHAAASAG